MNSKKKHELNRNLADEKQRFGIRKFSIGVASVLLGTSLMFGAGAQVVHADSNVDVSFTDNSASDMHEQNKQVTTTNNYTAQSEEAAKQENNNQEKTNNVDVKNQNGGGRTPSYIGY